MLQRSSQKNAKHWSQDEAFWYAVFFDPPFSTHLDTIGTLFKKMVERWPAALDRPAH
jgi:hypothetical protein